MQIDAPHPVETSAETRPPAPELTDRGREILACLNDLFDHQDPATDCGAGLVEVDS